MGSDPGMRLVVVHLRKNFGVRTPSKLHKPSENIMGGYLFTCGVVLWGFVFTSTWLQLGKEVGNSFACWHSGGMLLQANTRKGNSFACWHSGGMLLQAYTRKGTSPCMLQIRVQEVT